MVLLYNAALLLASPLLLLYLVHRLVIRGKSREGFAQRLGFAPQLPPPPTEGRVWLHAVSAGEAVAAAAIVRRLQEEAPGVEVVISTTTPAGQQQARRLIPGARAWFYFPFDFLPCVALALLRVRPTAVAPVETEVWPNWLWVARKLGIRTALVNGQFADKGFRGARKARWLYRWALGLVDVFAMQSRLAAERGVFLGAPEKRVRLIGNAKFDQAVPPPAPAASEAVRRALEVDRGRVLWIAASTHPGEEEQVLAAFRRLREAVPDLALLMAPRHIERAAAVLALVRCDGWAAGLRSEQPGPPLDVLVLDTMGELAGLYALGDVVFLGGSLQPIGGHDILQPMLHGKPTLFGPHMHNQRDLAEFALRAEAAIQVRDEADLADQVALLLRDPGRAAELTAGARTLLDENAGAAREYARILAQLARRSPAPAPAMAGEAG
jgi:3-deoxy-D-manno-octulosonic-acid transferase